MARSLAEISDTLIAHPNVLNGAGLYWPLPNTLYVEGYALDKFAAGCYGLQPVHQNRVGLILDRAIEPDLQLRHLQAADAARATLGLDLTEYVVTDAPLEVELRMSDSGASWGTIGNPDSLLRAAEKSIQKAGAEAIAVVARFPDDEDAEALEKYRHGEGVDAIAGAEAVISHLIVRTFQIPCAHAPALSPLPLDPQVSPRAAAEELGYTFLPCVLVGLSRAPQLVSRAEAQRENSLQSPFSTSAPAPLSVSSPSLSFPPFAKGGIWQSYSRLPNTIWAEQVDAVIVPATACGGSAILSFSQTRALIIAVRENQTQMQVSPEKLGINALEVNSYLEALGALVAHRAGISPAALSPKISPITRID